MASTRILREPSSMFSSVKYNRSVEDFEEESQWLAEEWEKWKQESADGNDSDTLSCSEFACIDDVREDEDSLRVISTSNYEYHTTDYNTLSLCGFGIDHDFINEPNEDQADNVDLNFPFEQQDYYSYENNTRKDKNYLESTDFIDRAQTSDVRNSEFKEQSDQGDVANVLNEEKNGVNCDDKHEYSVDMSSFIEDKVAEDHEETGDHSNEITDDVNSRFCDDVLEFGSDEDENKVELVNFNADDKELTKNEKSSDLKEYSAQSINVIVIGKELKSYEQVILHETEPSDYVQESLNGKQLTDQSTQKQNYSQDKNIKHQTTNTCDILFRDKERSPADMFICEYCQKVFANQYKLDSHRYRHHGDRKENQERNVARPKIKSKASDDWPPNIQILARRVNGKKVFFCDECSYSVDRCDSITKHMFRVHNNGRPVPQFQCEVCGKMFVDRAYLRNHKVSHLTDKRHGCEICGREFHRQPSLKRHLQTHTVDRQYSCTLCDYQTNRKHMIYKHVEYHKLGRAYTCLVCHKLLYTQLAYRSHMYQHRVSINSCSFCKVGFSSKERMMSHMRKTHSAYEINVYQPKHETLE